MHPALATTTNPVFRAYVCASLALSLNLLALWVSSGAVRARSGVAINPEDGARYSAPVRELDPPAVARILRVHRNAEAVTYPFLILALVYVLAGGRARTAVPIFLTFTLARIAHSIVYLKAMQPWRTIAFATSLLALIALMLAVLPLVI
jgi:microsomal prostaglandin-E synthase 1